MNKTMNRGKLVDHLKARLAAAEAADEDNITIARRYAKYALKLLDGEVKPGAFKVEDNMKRFLDEQTLEERVNFVLNVIFDWDGFTTADNLGSLLNEAYAYLSYPCKKEGQ